MTERDKPAALFDLDDDLVASFPSVEDLPDDLAPEIEPVSPADHASAAPIVDNELDAVEAYFTTHREVFGPAVRQALDEVIAAGRTRRWNLDQCNNQEKAYVGVNLENVLRNVFDFPEGRRGMDFDVEGIDVDCKWSRTFGQWQIPKEAVGHICLLVYGDDLDNRLAVGLIRIQDDILVGGNRDLKRTIQRPEGLAQARWIIPVEEGVLPDNFLMSISKADRDAILAPRGGNERAMQLFRRCEGIVIHRRVIEAIGQQVDEARRFRGEVRQALAEEGFLVLNGHWKPDRETALRLGALEINKSTEWVCVRADGSTPERRARLDPIRRHEAEAFRRQMIAELKEIRRRRAAERRASKSGELSFVEAAIEAELVERRVKAAVAKAETSAAAVDVHYRPTDGGA